MVDGEGRCRTGWTVKDVERRECHDEGLCVTLAKNGNRTETGTGKNHNFYTVKARFIIKSKSNFKKY